MRALHLVLLCAFWPVALIAQERDVGFLVGFLEEQLSSAGREVRIDGFSGALRARATIERLTIADAQGDWLIIEDAELDWNRAAVLRGDIQISALTAQRIEVLRRPQTNANALPEAAAAPFALPDLPVAIAIETVASPLLRLGANVIAKGQPALDLSLDGRATLADGSGAFDLNITKLSGPVGAFTASIFYRRDSQTLGIDLDLQEAPNGVLAALLGLPGTPSVALTLQGEAPISDFGAALSLATDGQPRLTGSFQTTVDATAQTRKILADVSGDLTPLLDPELRNFFGSDLSLSFDAIRASDGALDLNALRLSAQSLQAEGSGRISASGWPDRLALRAAIRSADGTATRLPVPGDRVSLGDATARLSYDRNASDALRAEIAISAFTSDTIDISKVALKIDGTLSPSAEEFDALVMLDATGFSPANPALADALGGALRAQFQVAGAPNDPLSLTEIEINTDTATLAGTASLSNLSGGIDTRLDLSVDARDLRPFSGLAQRPLGGALVGQLTGTATLLSGAFDLILTASGRTLTVNIPQADALLVGESALSVDARRDETGLTLRNLTLASPHAGIDAYGRFAEADTQLSLAAQVETLARILPGFPGRANLDLSLSSTTTGALGLSGATTGPGGLDLRLSGTVSPDFTTVDLGLRGGAQLALANPFLASRSLTGQASADLTLRGQLALDAIAGTITLRDARLSDPALPVSILDGNGTVSLGGAQAVLALSAAGSQGGQIVLRGPISLTAPNTAALDITLSDLGVRQGDVLQTSVSGQVQLAGPLTAGGRISGSLLLGPTEVRLATFNAAQSGGLPGLRHVDEPSAVRSTRAQAGFIQKSRAASSGAPLALDISLAAPNQVFVRGRGLDAELGGSLQLRGTTADIRPEGQFSLIRGRLDLLGQRLTLEQGSAVLEGALIPQIRLLARAEGRDMTLNVLVDGPATEPALTITSDPDMPQDAALAQFLFGRGLGQLSPLQAAQLASALVTLTGDGSGGILERLRESTGLDDFDVTSGSDGEGPALRAGKYLSDNIYSDVTLGTDGRSSVTLNLDVSPSVTVRGSTDTDGRTGLGVFFERDY
jgi:translocation and assembly module TamB